MKTKIIVVLSLMVMFYPVHYSEASANLDMIVQSQLGDDNISVSIREIDSGEIVYEKNGETAMKPASTLKLLTASSALELLGPDYRFKTRLYIDGKQKGAVLDGNVYIKGGGDPTLQMKDFAFMASILKHYGIHQIKGNLYGDDTFFTGKPLTPGILKEDESYYFASRISALTMSPDNDYDAGTIIINVDAAKIGESPQIAAEPGTGGMGINNLARTVGKDQKNTIEIIREYGTNQITITGNIPYSTTFKDWVTLNEPTLNTLEMVKETFEDFGVAFSKQSELERGKVSKNAKLLFTKSSLPIDSLMYPFLKFSNNSIADILTKTLGAETKGKGSTEKGIQALKEFGDSIGLRMEKWTLEDGSGMSLNNKVSANEISHLLSKMNVHPTFLSLYKSLPVGGQTDRLIGGSLKKRFNEELYKNRVIAKTGHIEGVYTLAGYIHANSGMTYTFAVMTQNQTSNRISAIDEVVKQIINEY